MLTDVEATLRVRHDADCLTDSGFATFFELLGDFGAASAVGESLAAVAVGLMLTTDVVVAVETDGHVSGVVDTETAGHASDNVGALAEQLATSELLLLMKDGLPAEGSGGNDRSSSSKSFSFVVTHSAVLLSDMEGRLFRLLLYMPALL